MIKRLKEEMLRQGINAKELSIRANIGHSFVYDLLSGRSANPTANKILAIANALGVSVQYLLSESTNDNSGDNPSDQFIVVPLFLNFPENNNRTSFDSYLFNKDWLTGHLKVAPEKLQMLIINGDSMHPTINNNDVVLVDTSCKIPIKAGIFILLNNSSIIARRLEFAPDNKPGKVFISPDNPKYSAHTCDISELNIIGRIAWVSREV